jgi:hypothetical protein
MGTENISNEEKGNGVLADVISCLSDEQIDSIIYNLDEYARDYDGYEYGLPTHGEHIENMRILVKQFLNSL